MTSVCWRVANSYLALDMVGALLLHVELHSNTTKKHKDMKNKNTSMTLIALLKSQLSKTYTITKGKICKYFI